MTAALTLEQQKANRKLWVKALRSGKYEQTTGKLKDGGGGMCCLGVLADLAGCQWTWDDYRGEFKADEIAGVAPINAMKFVGLRTSHGDLDASGARFLAHENDAGASFETIALLIESNPGLFTA
jgi:hypothetical protein